jgi:hypothetical protein
LVRIVQISSEAFKMRLRGFVCLVVLACCTRASAGPGTWTPLGYEGGRVTALLRDPASGALFAGTAGAGVFRSPDGARTWEAVTAGLLDRRVLSLAAGGGRIYAGTDDGGVLVTSDGGASWAEAREGLPQLTIDGGGRRIFLAVSSLVVHPAQPARLYAWTRAGVFRSDTAGASWQAASGGLPAQADGGAQLALDPLDPDRVYLAALLARPGPPPALHYFHVSTDGGTSWQPSEQGLSIGTARAPQAIHVSRADPKVLFLGLKSKQSSSLPALYRSSDRGGTWQALTEGLPADLSVSSFLEHGGRLLAGTGKESCFGGLGVFVWDERAASWGLHSSDLAGTTVRAMVSDGPELYAATGESDSFLLQDCGRGVFRSRTGGSRWEPASRGLVSTTVLAVAIDPADPDRFLAGTRGGGLYLTSDAGLSWTPVRGDLPQAIVTGIRLLPGTPPAMLVSLSGGESSGLWRSDDLGLGWEDLSGSGAGRLPRFGSFGRVEVLGAGHYLLGAKEGVFESVDDGASWQPRSSGIKAGPVGLSLRSLARSPLVEGRLAVSTEGQGVFRTDDLAAGWQHASEGLPASGLLAEPFERVPVLLWDRVLGDRIYAGTRDSGLYASSDAGGQWSALAAAVPLRSGGLPSLFGIYNPVTTLLQRSDGRLFAGSGYAEGQFFTGLYVSDDSGTSWTASNTGVPHAGILSADIGGPGDARVVLGTSGAGVVASADGGETFTPVSSFPSLAPRLRAIAVDPLDPQRIWVGSREHGVFRSLDGGLSFEPVSRGIGDPRIRSLIAFRTALVPSGLVLSAGTETGLWDSWDAGASWQPAAPGLPPGPVTDLLAASGGVASELRIWAAVEGHGLYVIQHPFTAFEPVGLSKTVTALVREEDTGLVFAGTAGEGVWESQDGHGGWFAVNDGLPPEAHFITKLELEPGTGRRTRQTIKALWVGTRSGAYVFRGTSSRRSMLWEDTGLGEVDVLALRYVPGADVLYGATEDGVLLLAGAARNDADLSVWQDAGSGLEGSASIVRSLELLPAPDGGAAQMLGASDGGLFSIDLAPVQVPASGGAWSSLAAALAGLMLLRRRAG